MTMHDLTTCLDKLGVALSLRLVVDAPRGVLTPEIREALADFKPLLLVHLAREEQWESLRHERWGPGLDDGEPGIIIPTETAR